MQADDHLHRVKLLLAAASVVACLTANGNGALCSALVLPLRHRPSIGSRAAIVDTFSLNPPAAVSVRHSGITSASSPQPTDGVDDPAALGDVAAESSGINRRGALRGLLFVGTIASLAANSRVAVAAAADLVERARGAIEATRTEAETPPATISGERITIPLSWTGEAFVVSYRVGGKLFRAVLDTGSPFLMVPGNSCVVEDGGVDARSWRFDFGCSGRGDGTVMVGNPSGLKPTYERFDGNEGEVEWRSAPFSFADATGSLLGPALVTFGVASDSLMAGPGGVFFGLVKHTDARIRPSFLGQTSVSAFEIDLRSGIPRKTLTLSTTPLLGGERAGDRIPMVNDLNRRYGDPTLHYTALAASVTVNGIPLASSGTADRRGGGAGGRPIYAIFDTGVTGMVISQDLFDERYAAARANRERSLWGDVAISFVTAHGDEVVMSATKPLTTPLPQAPWKRGFRGHIVVVGLAFLDGNRLTVDVDEGNLGIDT